MQFTSMANDILFHIVKQLQAIQHINGFQTLLLLACVSLVDKLIGIGGKPSS